MKLRMETDGSKHIMPVALGVASQGLSLVILANMTYYLTTSIGLAGTVVGTILLLSRLFDGVSDLIAGHIIDRCHFKLGKARPFDLMNIPMWIALVLCYSVPQLNTVAKIIYVFIMYNLCQTVFFTFVSVSGSVRGKRTFNEETRPKAISLSGILTAVFSTIGGILLPILIDSLEYQPHGWTMIALFFAVPGIVMTLAMFFLAPEMPGREEELVQKSASFVDNVRILSKNRYLPMLLLVVVASTLVLGLNGSSATYYFKYYVGDLKISSVLGIVSIAGYIFLAVLPAITKKIGNRKTMVVTFVIVVIGCLLRLIMPTNVPWLAFCALLVTVGTAVGACTRDLMLMDAMQYSEVLTKANSDGSYAAIKGFADKIANGLAPFLIGVMLDAFHFEGDAAVQPDSAIGAIKFLYIFLPAIIAGVGLVCAHFCRMDEDMKRLQKQETV